MKITDHVTENDVTNIEYFINAKGDITRWSDWEKRKPVIEQRFPELIAAIKQLEVAERTLKAVVKQVVGTSKDEL